jgi:hypothetical protein
MSIISSDDLGGDFWSGSFPLGEDEANASKSPVSKEIFGQKIQIFRITE